MRVGVLLVAFQICTVLSALAEAIFLPSGDHAMFSTAEECFRYVLKSFPKGNGALVNCFDASVWHTCSKALANSNTLAKRCSGLLASAFWITWSIADGNAGSLARREGGGTRTCCVATSMKDPEKRRSPLNHS